MKKIFLILMIGICALTGNSQIYLGWNEAEILSERSADEELARDTLQDGTPYLFYRFIDSAQYTRRYFFDKMTQRCNLYVVEPADQKALETFVRFCNENYTPMSEKRWKTLLLNGFPVAISLEQGSVTGQNYFYFEYKK